MTVKDAIAILQQCPQYAPVMIADWNEGYREPTDAGIAIHNDVVIITSACDREYDMLTS